MHCLTRSVPALLVSMSLVLGSLVLGSLALGACGGGQSSLGANTSRNPVEYTFSTVNGRSVSLASQRGSRVLLFFFATFDTQSQAAIRPLSRFAQQHDAVVLGIISQPDPGTFAAMFEEALHPSFTICFDPNGRFPSDTTVFGDVLAVPTYIVLDAEGRIERKQEGALSYDALEAFFEHR